MEPGQQIQTTRPDGLVMHYSYDLLGRTATMTYPDGAYSYKYLYDEIGRMKGVVETSPAYPGGNVPIVVEGIGASNAATAYNWFHTDALGSVRATSNASGNLVNSIGYSPFGQTTSLAASPFQFAGMILDGESGLYYDQARYYSPQQGRFISADPIGAAGGVNIYAYAGNDPINNVDPTGLDFWDDLGNFFGGIGDSFSGIGSDIGNFFSGGNGASLSLAQPPGLGWSDPTAECYGDCTNFGPGYPQSGYASLITGTGAVSGKVYFQYALGDNGAVADAAAANGGVLGFIDPGAYGFGLTDHGNISYSINGGVSQIIGDPNTENLQVNGGIFRVGSGVQPFPSIETQYAQMGPMLFGLQPWIEELTPLEDIPLGEGGGPRSGMNFPRNMGKPQLGDKCIYCGRPATSRDHIIPKSQGGDGTIENLGRSCTECNSSKGGRTPTQWYDWMGRPWPQA